MLLSGYHNSDSKLERYTSCGPGRSRVKVEVGLLTKIVLKLELLHFTDGYSKGS
jgi:hypothetical protein